MKSTNPNRTESSWACQVRVRSKVHPDAGPCDVQEVVPNSHHENVELIQRGTCQEDKAQKKQHEPDIHDTQVLDAACDPTHGGGCGYDRNESDDPDLSGRVIFNVHQSTQSRIDLHRAQAKRRGHT